MNESSQQRVKLFAQRFSELEKQMNELREVQTGGFVQVTRYPDEPWQAWAMSTLNLLAAAFGRNSIYFETFSRIHQGKRGSKDVDAAKGVFRAAKADFDGGNIFKVEREVSGEIFADIVAIAKEALASGNHVAAAVLASAALEDALRRFAIANGLDVREQPMQQVVNALKSKGLVGGAQKSLLDVMPKIRNQAMHADWQELTAAEAASVIAFVEQFLVANF